MKAGEKIKRVRLRAGLSRPALAKRTGLDADTILNVETGRTHPRCTTLRSIVAALDIDSEWLADESQGMDALGSRGSVLGRERLGGPQAEGQHPNTTVRFVERGRAAPVFPIGADHERAWSDGGYPVGVSDKFLGLPGDIDDDKAFWCEIFGDSMVPELNEGDYVLFAPSRARWKEGAICLVRTHDWATIKRVYTAGGSKLRLVPTNREYPEQVVDREVDVIQLMPKCGYLQLDVPVNDGDE